MTLFLLFVRFLLVKVEDIRNNVGQFTKQFLDPTFLLEGDGTENYDF